MLPSPITFGAESRGQDRRTGLSSGGLCPTQKSRASHPRRVLYGRARRTKTSPAFHRPAPSAGLTEWRGREGPAQCLWHRGSSSMHVSATKGPHPASDTDPGGVAAAPDLNKPALSITLPLPLCALHSAPCAPGALLLLPLKLLRWSSSSSMSPSRRTGSGT